MNLTLILVLSGAAYLAVAAAVWRPLCRWLYPTCLHDASWRGGSEEDRAQRALRSAGLQATIGSVLWPYVGLMALLFKTVPPVYRRIMDTVTAGVLPDPVPSSQPAADARSSARADRRASARPAEPVAIEAVVTAWTGTDDSTWHELHQHEVAEHMPDLAEALDRLALTYPGRS